MNHGAHVLIGIVTFSVYDILRAAILTTLHLAPGVSGLWLVGLVAACMGSEVPDILEPATSRAHRKFFHSKRILRTFVLLFMITAVAGVFSPVWFCLSCFLLGYLFHLLADSTTRAGLYGH
jgi:hypothetical protein